VPTGPKRAFHITRRDGGPFAFAGLWSIWYGPREDGDPRDADEAKLRTCTILTTAANEAVAPLHDRMPIILAPEAEAVWLDTATPAPQLEQILAGLAPSQTAVRPVGPAVNDARYDGPECLAPPVESAQTALFES
jgi:putative SOS response-associated peptidase YedK